MPPGANEPEVSQGLQSLGKNEDIKTWKRIFIPRLLASALVLIVSLFSPTLDRPWLFFSLAGYLASLLLLTILSGEYLRLKRMRLFRAAIDILCISLVTHATGGLDSLWFLAYAFPIISVSKHLKQQWSYALVFFAVALCVLLNTGVRIDLLSPEQTYALIVKSVLLLGLALLGTKLHKSERDREVRLLEAIEEILASSTHPTLEDALWTLVTKATLFTGSSHGSLRATHPSGQTILAETGDPPNATRVKISEEISLDGETIGEIQLTSHRSFHYDKRERELLKGFAALAAMAFRNADLFSQIQVGSEERKQRLRMLYEIGEQLTASRHFERFLDQVVSLTLERLDSEEAALFLPSEKSTETIRKVAVSAGDRELARQLKTVETIYKSGDSLTGEVYATGKKLVQQDIPLSTAYSLEYSSLLPSKVAKHYIGIPLKVGNKTLGVLRVLNKKSSRYSYEDQCFALSQHPFSEEDEELMETIASQVAMVLSNKQLLERAKESERYLKNIIANSPDPIIVVDPDGRIKVFNQACVELFDCLETDALDRSVINFYPSAEHAREIGRAIWEAENHRIQNKDAWVAGPDGEAIPVSLSASWLMDETKTGEVKRIGSVGIFKDQRELNRLRDEKLQNEKLTAIGRLAHTVGHELKHEIGAALLYVEPLLRTARQTNDLETRDVYQSMRDILWGATEKLQNLLMVGKPRKPDRRLYPVTDLFREVENAFSKQAEAIQIELQIRHPANGQSVHIDVGQLLQVFSNLFTNSIHAIEKRRQMDSKFTNALIEVRLCNIAATSLEITWVDNGCGIETTKLPRVFEAFYTDKRSGNGLGLFQTKTILSNHEGSISMESKEGQNTKVTLMLPAVS